MGRFGLSFFQNKFLSKKNITIFGRKSRLKLCKKNFKID